MIHLPGHIICGTGGTPVTDKTITVYDAPLSVAIKIDPKTLEEQAIATGMDPDQAAKRVSRLVNMIEFHWERWAEFVEEKLCLEYTRHEPHPENIDD